MSTPKLGVGALGLSSSRNGKRGQLANVAEGSNCEDKGKERSVKLCLNSFDRIPLSLNDTVSAA